MWQKKLFTWKTLISMGCPHSLECKKSYCWRWKIAKTDPWSFKLKPLWHGLLSIIGIDFTISDWVWNSPFIVKLLLLYKVDCQTWNGFHLQRWPASSRDQGAGLQGSLHRAFQEFGLRWVLPRAIPQTNHKPPQANQWTTAKIRGQSTIIAFLFAMQNIQSRPIQMRIYHSNERCRISAILRHRGKLF